MWVPCAQGRPSLSSMRSLSGALPCVTVICVMPAGWEAAPVAATAGRESGPSTATAAAAQAVPTAALCSSGEQADGGSAAGAAVSVADAGAAVPPAGTDGAQMTAATDQQPGGDAAATGSRQAHAGHADADHRRPDGNAAAVIVEGQLQPQVRHTSASGTQPGGNAPADAVAQRHLPVRYTKPLLKGVLQLMGCKQRHAHKASLTPILHALILIARCTHRSFQNHSYLGRFSRCLSGWHDGRTGFLCFHSCQMQANTGMVPCILCR